MKEGTEGKERDKIRGEAQKRGKKNNWEYKATGQATSNRTEVYGHLIMI